MRPEPGRIIPGVLRPFADEHPERRVAVIGEPIWPGRSPAEYAAGVQHEALINLAFTGQDTTILCPYDSEGLGAAALADAERTHPVMVSDGDRTASTAYGDPARVAATANADFASAPSGAYRLAFDDGELSAVRRFVADRAANAGLGPDRVADLQLAVSEVAANVLVHTRGPGTLHLWRDAGTLVCEVSDSGQLTDIMAGRIQPAPDNPGGRGLLIANHPCDLVQIDPGAAGTTVRLHLRVPDRRAGGAT